MSWDETQQKALTSYFASSSRPFVNDRAVRRDCLLRIKRDLAKANAAKEAAAEAVRQNPCAASSMEYMRVLKRIRALEEERARLWQ